jgi:hypothetical protein
MVDNRRPTKRAPDKWESAQFRSIFSGFGLFLLPNIVHARPLAGNANRWAADMPNEKQLDETT